MTYKPPAPETHPALKKMVTAAKVVSFLMMVCLFFTSILGIVTMSSFIREETIQSAGFSYGLPMMNKEFELSYAILLEQEAIYLENCREMSQVWNLKAILNPFRLYNNLRRAFVSFAQVSNTKIQKDKAYLEHMIQKQKQLDYQNQLVKGRWKK